jgi:hypothetical protein
MAQCRPCRATSSACAARHRHGGLGQRRPAVDVAARVQLRGQPGQHLRPQRAVALGQRGQGLLQQADAGGLPGEPARQHHPAQPEPHDRSGAGDIAEGGVRQRLGRAQPTGDGGRLLEAPAGLLCVPGPPLDVAESQQQLPVPVPARVLQHRQQVQGPRVVPGRVLVGEQRRGVVAGTGGVLDGQRRIAQRGRPAEVVRELRQMRPEVVVERLLEHQADAVVELEPALGRQVVVQGLAHQLMGEGVAPWSRRVVAHDPGPLCLR